MRIFIKTTLALALVACLIGGLGGKSAAKVADKNMTVNKVTGVDVLGRGLTDISGYRDDRYVGLFYFLWLGQQNQKELYDITDILRTHTLDDLINVNNSMFPNDAVYFFNEPLFGYYNSEDPWVIRKHIEMFIYAQIDFLVFDVTNGIYYDRVWLNVLKLLDEYRVAGYKVPKVVFFTNTRSDEAVKHVYQYLYKRELYKELWFYGPYDKPLIIANEDKVKDVPDEMKEFFHIRTAQWPLEKTKDDGFPYMDLAKPQHLYTDLMNVSVCQFSGPCSFGITKEYGYKNGFYGRGYSKDTPESGTVKHILEGKNFEEQWQNAIKADPEMVFVTGWNEWIAQKSNVNGWIDTFNTEWSRDIEMTKANGYSSDTNDYTEQGYGDNFYLQLVENVRKYKGIPINSDSFETPVEKTVDISKTTDWEDVNNIYYNLSTDKIERSFKGASKDLFYTQAKPSNFITSIKVTNDDSNLYFYINTMDNITQFDDKTNWMNLFIGINNKECHSWNQYNFVVNRNVVSDTTTTLEKVKTDNSFSFEKVSDVRYSVNGNVMQIEIPLSKLGIDKNSINIVFKVADSVEKQDDIMDYYVSGDSVPLGRLSYSYRNIVESTKFEPKSNNFKWAIPIIGLLAITGVVICGLLLKSKKK